MSNADPVMWWCMGGVVVLILVLVLWLVSLARRIDRLHSRIIAERAALERLLLRRSSEVALLVQAAPSEVDFAECDRTSSELLQSPHDQVSDDGLDRRDVIRGRADRVDVEAYLRQASALSQALRSELTAQVRAKLEIQEVTRRRLNAVDSTSYRIQLVRAIHNTDVAQVRELRGQAVVRILRIDGFAPMPQPIDFDDGQASV
ncbi:hypothetical protein [Schaalia vaccimaxillae]|uniref:hypothetical protein n=1 Tax=Schaalia vaccimaxillae TaxID=183916 RepID=UPI0003B4F3B5|nr:hypothetical protein [Schaalia vaccimaxillae]